MKSYQNSDQHFPNLRRYELERQAQRWVRKFSGKYPNIPIQRIILYRYSTDRFQEFFPEQKPSPIEYIVIIEVGISKKDYPFISDLSAFQDLQKAIEHNEFEQFKLDTEDSIIPSFDDQKRLLAFITADFENVYKRRPRRKFRNEWKFKLKCADEELSYSVKIDEPHWVLYASESQSEIQELIEKTRPEIELLYTSVKKVGLSSPRQDLQRTAVTYFDDNAAKFEIIRKEYLEDISIFDLTIAKEKRDFIGRILKKIIGDHGYGRKGAQQLYKLYTETD